MGDADTALAARDAAMVQVAIHDAMNGVLHQYGSIEVNKSSHKGADADAAGAEAAFRVLNKLFPKDKATLSKKLADSLTKVDDKRLASKASASASQLDRPS